MSPIPSARSVPIPMADFTDPENPTEIGYFDRGPIDAKMLVMGGSWSAYWYNGKIYSSEIARGLDIFELTPTKHLTQNEIEAAKSVKMDILNVQTQQMIEWPKSLTVAKAYIDQLERSGALDGKRITELRNAVQKAQGSSSERRNLKSHAASLDKSAASAKNAPDAERLRALADILRNPAA